MRILKRYGRREKFAVLCGTQISEDNHPKFHYYFNVEQKLLPKVIPILTVVQEDSCNNTRSQSDAMGMHNKGAVQDIGATDDTLKSSAAELLQRGISWRNSKACHRGIQTTLSMDRGLLKERRLSFSGSIMQRDIC